MPGNLNFGGSVVKREARDTQEVLSKLMQDGWSKTGSRGERITYIEKSGVSLTVVNGPMGTVVFPSGPLRGSLFGKDVNILSKTSTIGLGTKGSDSSNPTQKTSSTSGDSYV